MTGRPSEAAAAPHQHEIAAQIIGLVYASCIQYNQHARIIISTKRHFPDCDPSSIVGWLARSVSHNIITGRDVTLPSSPIGELVYVRKNFADRFFMDA